MKRITALALAVAVLFAPPGRAFASITRVLSMGMDNWQIHDSSNFWFNPALLKNAPDTVHLEAGTQATAGAGLDAGSQWGGFHKAFGRHVFAIYVRRPYATNDFSGIANPILTPLLGGNITGASVIGTAGLDTGVFGNTDFGINGPFGTDDGAGPEGALGITGAPSTLTKDIADPVNYFDILYAVPIGWFAFGLRFNYARNAPGEVRRSYYDNIGSGAATEGTMLMERVTDEFNIQPGFSIKSERVRWDVVGHVTLPYYRMFYEELGPGGRFARGRIDQDNTMGGAFATQLTIKIREQASLGLNVRVGDYNTAGTASYVEDTDGDGVLDFNRSAAFNDRRRFIAADVTWNHLFDRALLVASVGYQRSQVKRTWNFVEPLVPGNADSDMSKTDNDIVPMRIGMEMTPWDRIALRAGIQKNWFAETDVVTHDSDGGAPTVKTNTSTAIAEAGGTANGVGLSFGMGFRIIRNLSIDTVVRQYFFFDGPNFIGGTTAGANKGGLFAQGTLVYRFGLAANSDDTLKPLLSYDEIELY